MNLWNSVIAGWKEVFAHRFRSLLTMLGMMLGVASLVAMSALIKGKANGMREALAAVGGLNRFRVVTAPGLPSYQSHRMAERGGLTLDDVRALQHSAPLLESIHPTARLPNDRWAYLGGKWQRVSVFLGTWPDALQINEHRIEHGRMISSLDDELAQSVCVIGTGIRDQLFGNPEETGDFVVPLGEIIRIGSVPFQIIGMFSHYESEERRGERLARVREAAAGKKQSDPPKNQTNENYLFREKNTTIYIPLHTMQSKMMPRDEIELKDTQLSSIDIRIRSGDLLEPALQQARNILLMTHDGLEDFSFETQMEWASEFSAFLRNARISGGIVAMIALVVGGIGIANIMLASLSERIREIGIRKAVGATNGAVFLEILIESAVLALVGALAGLIASYGVVGAISTLVPLENKPVITVPAMIVAVGFSVVFGMVAGLFPAVKASRLHPIQALRHG